MGVIVDRLKTAVPGAVQLAGAVSAATGLYMLAGLAWALLAAGVAVLAAGTLAEVKGGR